MTIRLSDHEVDQFATSCDSAECSAEFSAPASTSTELRALAAEEGWTSSKQIQPIFGPSFALDFCNTHAGGRP